MKVCNRMKLRQAAILALCCLATTAYGARHLKQEASLLDIATAPGGSLGLMNPADTTTDVTAQWVHAVASAFNVDSKTLVVPPAPVPIDTTTPSLWETLNTVNAPTKLGQSSVFHKLNDVYSLLLNNLHPINTDAETALRVALGSRYSDWIDHKKQFANRANKDQDMFDYFKEWAMTSDVDYNTAVNAFYRQLNDPVNVAIQKSSKCAGDIADCDFNIEYDTQVRPRVEGAAKVVINLDTATASKDINDTMYNYTREDSEGDETSDYWLVNDVDVQYNSTVRRLQVSRIVVEAEFEHGTPTSFTAIAPGNWYDSAIVSMAKQSGGRAFNQGNQFDAFFGKEGMLRYINSNLLVVSGQYKLKLTFFTGLSEEERAYLQTKVESDGMWPFFDINSKTTDAKVDVRIDNESTTFEYSSNYLPAPVVIGSQVALVQ